ncbi:MAG: hypothetical protein Tsb005_12090 [Gammaproteobacteria bacterium]
MNITFKPLCENDFTILLAWLQSPHIKKWWDQDVGYTMDLVKEKYQIYIHGYNQIGDQQKTIYASIIYVDDTPIGYIQYYNAYDFLRDGYELKNLPKSLAAINMFVGKEKGLDEDISLEALELFLYDHIYQKFNFAFVELKAENLEAISFYEKANFKKHDEQNQKVIMLRPKIIPPWAKYPEYHSMDFFWRQSGEYYLHDAWKPYWIKLTEAEQQEILTIYPMPEDWAFHQKLGQFLANEEALKNLNLEEEKIVLVCLKFCCEKLLEDECFAEFCKEKKLNVQELKHVLANYYEEKEYMIAYINVISCLKIIMDFYFKNSVNQLKHPPLPRLEIAAIYKKITDGRYSIENTRPEISFAYRQPYFKRILLLLVLMAVSMGSILGIVNFHSDSFDLNAIQMLILAIIPGFKITIAETVHEIGLDIFGVFVVIPITFIVLKHLIGDIFCKPRLIFNYIGLRFTRYPTIIRHAINRPLFSKWPLILPKKLIYYYHGITDIRLKYQASWLGKLASKKLVAIIIDIKYSEMSKPYKLVIKNKNLPQGSLEEIVKILCERVPSSVAEKFIPFSLNYLWNKKMIDNRNRIEKIRTLSIVDGRIFCSIRNYGGESLWSEPLERFAGIIHEREYELPTDETIWEFLLPSADYDYVELLPADYDKCLCCEGKAVEVKIRIFKDIICWELLSPSPVVSLLFDRKQYERELYKISKPPENYIIETSRINFYTVDDILENLKNKKIVSVRIKGDWTCVLIFENGNILSINPYWQCGVPGDLLIATNKYLCAKRKDTKKLKKVLKGTTFSSYLRGEFNNDFIINLNNGYYIKCSNLIDPAEKQNLVYRYWKNDHVKRIETFFGKISNIAVSK